MFNFIAFASFGKNIFLTFLTSPRNVGDLDFTGFGQHKPIYPMVKALQNLGVILGSRVTICCMEVRSSIELGLSRLHCPWGLRALDTYGYYCSASRLPGVHVLL